MLLGKRKDQGWKKRLSENVGQGPRGPKVEKNRRIKKNRREENKEEKREEQGEVKKTVAILLVPYSVGGILQKKVQNAENSFVEIVGGECVRVVEKGGETLLNMLGRNDPWSSRRSCTDKDCPSCSSRRWLQEMKKEAKKTGTTLPSALLQSTSQQCRREGHNYAAQCMKCVMDLGRSSTYWGESSRSSWSEAERTPP